MANDDVGTLICPCCKKTAAVRKYSGQKRKGLYWNCAHCGVFMPTLRGGQDWILSNAKMYGPEGAPEIPLSEEPAPAPATPPQPAPAPALKEPAPAAPLKKKSPLAFLDDL